MEGLSEILIYSSFLLLIIALVLAFFRLAKGPSVHDRIASLDLIASIVMGFILLYSVLIKNALYIDIVLVMSLISFVGTVAISTYLKQKP
ncbi:MAG: hypothetical protein JXJ22_14230 [Bacteroidales bacterium]|nr:hypothetical protein [Bacteroidales bacterium]